MKASALVILLFLALSALVEGKQFGVRRKTVNEIILHSIGGPKCKDGAVIFTSADGGADKWIKYFNGHQMLSIHYVIGKDGEVKRGVPEDQIANHALGHNLNSVGIELVNRGDGQDPYPKEQIDALVRLIDSIAKNWRICKGSITTHAAIDQRQFECGGKRVPMKQDPGTNFPLTEVVSRISDSCS